MTVAALIRAVRAAIELRRPHFVWSLEDGPPQDSDSGAAPGLRTRRCSRPLLRQRSMIPSPWEFALLTGAAYRLWRLIAEDDITKPLRDKLQRTGWARDLTECPWCLGSWIAAAWLAAWWIWPNVLYAAAVFAAMAVPGAVATVLHSLTEDE